MLNERQRYALFKENISKRYLWYREEILEMLDGLGLADLKILIIENGMYRWYPEEISAVLAPAIKHLTEEQPSMSIIKTKQTQHVYTISLDTMRDLIARDLGVPAEELTVKYVDDTIGGDPLDRYGAIRGVSRIEVTHIVP